jgi:hypothetical protein
MEHLFSPCNRLRDLAESRGRLEDYSDQDDIESSQELNLDISTEELRSAERVFTYADFVRDVRKRSYSLLVDTACSSSTRRWVCDELQCGR